MERGLGKFIELGAVQADILECGFGILNSANGLCARPPVRTLIRRKSKQKNHNLPKQYQGYKHLSRLYSCHQWVV